MNPGGDGPVEQIRLGESEIDVALNVAELRRKRQRFAQPQEIVRLIGEPDEAARKSADAAREADRLLALLLHLQLDVHRAGLHVVLQLRVFGLDRIEIAELVQAQEAQFPVAVVEDLAFIEQEFAADDFVARRRVAGEFDAPDKKLLLLVELPASGSRLSSRRSRRNRARR